MASRKAAQEFAPLNVKPLVKQIAKEKELDASVIKSAIESAILSAAAKRASVFKDPRPDLDLDSGEMRIYVKKKIVVSANDPAHEIDILSAKALNSSNMLGSEIEVEIDPKEFGRIAAQAVRQGILQRLRDAERDRVYQDYRAKVGQVVTGIVQRNERRDVIVALGKTECLLSWQEVPQGIRYRLGDRVRCLIVDVRRTPKGPQVFLSRTRSELVRQLFATEVPEISDGTVRIVEIAREPGVRTKIAVSSNNSDVDPVGACVGMKGSRVQMIVRELDNEKIDIVPYSIHADTFIRSALNPAKIVNVKLNEIEKRAEVVVERDSLSKAIGKKGQNAKLAARLTGWKIDIRPQEEQEAAARLNEIQRQYLDDFLAQIEGLPQIAREAIARTTDFNSVEKLAEKQARELMNFTGDNLELADEIVTGAREYLEGLREMAESTGEGDDSGIATSLRAAEELANKLGGPRAPRSVSVGGTAEDEEPALPEAAMLEGFSAEPEPSPADAPPELSPDAGPGVYDSGADTGEPRGE